MIPLARPLIGEDEKNALNAVIDSGWITTGEQVKAFEQAFATLHGVDEAVAVSSCTAGLHLCLAALGIGSGDHVLVPSLTFVATVNAILYVGATPVFVDIESLESPHISITDAQQRLTEKVKAVIVMHYAGYSVDVSSWRQFADNNELFLIEDAAHAPGLDGVGQKADAAAFSFFGNKNMSTAEGGMVIARDPEITSRIRSMRSHGMTTSTLDRHKGHAFEYDVTMLGFNYRIDELRAALGLCQLSKLPKWNTKRRELVALYRNLVSQLCPEIIAPFSNAHSTVAHLFPVLLPRSANRHTVMAKLRDAEIQSSIHYLPVHQFSFYKKEFPGVHLTVTEEFCSRVITLPLYPALNEKDLKKIVMALKSGLKEVN
jgi:dTDP-4-amino-4,6-dideoxygalactose transaminase